MPSLGGVFTIRLVGDSSLYLTAPPEPKAEDKLTLDKQLLVNGVVSPRQLWRAVPIDGTPYSHIQNYAEPSGLVIDIYGGDISKPLQLYGRGGGNNQKFFPVPTTKN